MKGYLGIDVSKGYADFTLLNTDKNQLVEVFQLDDTRAGHDCLEKQLECMIRDHGLSHVYSAVESTGGLENNWYNSLVEWSKVMPVSVARLNPSGVKHNIGAGLSRNVTDGLSARYIAEYMISHPQAINFQVQDPDYGSYRSLHNHINLQKKQKTQLINQLKAILYSGFPEMQRYSKDSVPNWVLLVLKNYPSVKSIAGLTVEELCRIKHVDTLKAQSIIAKAQKSVASRKNDATAFLIQSLATQILEKQELIGQHKKYLEQTCKGPQVTLLTSVKGIGSYSAAAIMIEIEDIRRFKTAKQLVSYFGLHPEYKESGDKKGQARISKKGRASMRGILYMCAQTAVMCDQHMKGIYHNHRSKGKVHRQAIGVIMQKLLRVIWGILTSQIPYTPAIDQQNQSKKDQEPAEKTELDRKRRFQQLDQEAPITNKQTKKRRMHQESQAPDRGQARDHLNTSVTKITNECVEDQRRKNHIN